MQAAISCRPAQGGGRRSSLTAAGQVARQALVCHVHLCWSGWIWHGVLSSHVSTDHPEPATRLRSGGMKAKPTSGVHPAGDWASSRTGSALQPRHVVNAKSLLVMKCSVGLIPPVPVPCSRLPSPLQCHHNVSGARLGPSCSPAGF